MVKKTSTSLDVQAQKDFWEDRGEETLAPMSFVSLATFEQDDKVGFSSIRESHVRSDSFSLPWDIR